MTELFSIRTSQVQLTWSRRKDRPPPVEAAGAGGAPGVMPASGAGAPEVTVHAGGPLFEQTDYVLFAQSRSGDPVRIRHADPNLLRHLESSDGGRVVYGVVNFGTQVGLSRFVVEAGGRVQFSFEVEVFPTKLDYRTDYEALRADVQELSAALVMEYLRATYRPAANWPVLPSDLPGWALMLRYVMDGLEHALDYLAAHPHRITERMERPMRSERIRRPDGLLRRAVQRRGGDVRREGAFVLPARLPSYAAHYTLDTPEHRWLRGRLRHVRATLASLVDAERDLPPTPRRRRIVGELEALGRRVERLLRLAPLDAAGEQPGPAPPMRLVTAPGYREAYQACLALEHGLRLDGGPVGLGLKDLHLLYEYWCFLTLARLVASVTGQRWPAGQLLRAERYGLHYRLRSGHRHAVRFRLGGQRLVLVYNPRFGGRGYLVPQRPDFVLTLRRTDGTRARYIVDAKYRLDATAAYVRRYGTPGPPAEALNTLHRYRDAILDREVGRGTVVEAVALFPYREPEPGAFAASRHGRVLEEVGVGAVPLLPGATHYLESWLRRILGTA